MELVNSSWIYRPGAQQLWIEDALGNSENIVCTKCLEGKDKMA